MIVVIPLVGYDCFVYKIISIMDLITFIKKEEPVDYLLTTDDVSGKVISQTSSKELIEVEKFTVVIKQEEVNCWNGQDNDGLDIPKESSRNGNSNRRIKIFKCDKCSMGYKSLRTLHKHIQNHSRQDKVQCKICKRFYYKLEMQRHIQIHTGPPYTCPICLKKFSVIHSWKQHCRIMHREKTFRCDKCSRSFLQKHSLVDHMQTHQERKLNFVCKECGVRFCREESFTSHLKKLHSDIPQQLYRCSNTSCNRIFRSRRYFQSHICRKLKLPKKIKNFNCATCQIDFHTKKSLKDHQRVHRQEQRIKSFNCSKCQIDFVTKKALTEHQRLHRWEHREQIRKRRNIHAKRRMCENCNRNFKITDASYQIHLAQNCPDKISYECDNCSRLFLGKFAILAHLSQAHKSNFECDICGSTFMKKVDIIAHILHVHSSTCFQEDDKGAFTCLRCRKDFVHVDLYLEHMQQGNCAYKFRCTICNSRFPTAKSLQRHDLYHSKRFQCAHCGRSYHNKNSLRMHMQRGEHRTNFHCKFCHKIFENKGSRNTHSWYHCIKNIGRFECDICESKFIKKIDIVKHMLVQHSPKSFKANENGTFTCVRCSGEFVGEDFFLKHIQMRNCTKRFQCNKCNRKLTRSLLENHDCKQRNEDQRNFKCEQCDSSFKTCYTLLQHMRRGEHRTSFECEYCHKIFQGKGSYMAHYKNFCRMNKPPERRPPELPTSFECKSCDRKFDNMGSYLTHCKYFCKINQPNESDEESVVVVAKLPVVPIYKDLYGNY